MSVLWTCFKNMSTKRENMDMYAERVHALAHSVGRDLRLVKNEEKTAKRQILSQSRKGAECCFDSVALRATPDTVTEQLFHASMRATR